MTPKDAFNSSALTHTKYKHSHMEAYVLIQTHKHTHMNTHFSRQIQFNHFSQASHCLSNQAYLCISFSISFLHLEEISILCVSSPSCSVYFGAALSVLPDSVSIVTATEHFLCSDGS